MRSRVVFIAVLGCLLVSAVPASAAFTIYTSNTGSMAAWEAAIAGYVNRDDFLFTQANVNTSPEVVPAISFDDWDTGAQVLTFPTSANLVNRTFSLHAASKDSDVDPLVPTGLTWVWESAVVGGSGSNTLAPGSLIGEDHDSFHIALTSGITHAIGVMIADSGMVTGESFLVIDTASGSQLFTSLPSSGGNPVFIGIVSDDPILSITYNEAPGDSDNIALVSVHFAQLPEVVWVPEPATAAMVGLSIFCIASRRRRR